MTGFYLSLALLLSLLIVGHCQRLATAQDKDLRYATNFRAVECESRDNKTAYFTFCFIKAYSRTYKTLNFGFHVFNARSIFVRMVAFYRYGNIYRDILDSKWINWCEVMKGANYNLFLKITLDVIRDSVPNLFHKCPYDGLNEFYNVSLNATAYKAVSIFPEGQYKYTTSFGKEPEKPLMVLTVHAEVKSPLKESFG